MKSQIDIFRERLEDLISNGANFDEIYDLSMALDKLIVAFYASIHVKH